jgi:hypothetical protein
MLHIMVGSLALLRLPNDGVADGVIQLCNIHCIPVNYVLFRRSLERTMACKFMITRTEFQVSSMPSIRWSGNRQEAFDDKLTSIDSIQTFRNLNKYLKSLAAISKSPS